MWLFEVVQLPNLLQQQELRVFPVGFDPNFMIFFVAFMHAL
jgi:hypothetical protein